MADGQQKPTSRYDDESDPLLADAQENGDVDGDFPAQKSTVSKVPGWFRRAARKLWSNRMIVAIILLLIGGLTALCVFFGGVFTAISTLHVANIDQQYTIGINHNQG